MLGIPERGRSDDRRYRILRYLIRYYVLLLLLLLRRRRNTLYIGREMI